MKKLIILIVLLPLLAACTNDVAESIQPSQDKRTAVEKILNDYCSKGSATRFSDHNIGNLTIGNVETKTYCFDGKTVREVTETTRADSDNSFFEISRADFTSDTGADGYAYLSTTPGKEGVFFFTPNGEISDTTYNGGLKMVLGNIPRAVGDIGYNGPEIPDSVTHIGTGVLLKTTWDQNPPYNKSMPHCTCTACIDDIKKKYPVGCTNIAVGQAIAYYGKFTPELDVNKNIKFKRLTRFAVPQTEEVENEISNFLYEVALRNNTTYSHNSSKASMFAAYELLQICGYDCNLVCGWLDPKRLNKALLYRHNPCIYSGFNEDGIGHAWVIDGCNVYETIQYHCNWGWGGHSDGWVIYEAITDPGVIDPLDLENIVIYIND